MMNNKKADLSLSINAIVILILAITILGLGLTFVRGLFKQAESKITEVTSASELANPPTRDNPTTLTPSQVQIRQKEKGKVLLAFLNPESASRGANVNKYCKLTVVVTDTDKELRNINGKDSPTDTDTSNDNLIVDGDLKINDVVIYNGNKVQMGIDTINQWTLGIDGSKVKAKAETDTEYKTSPTKTETFLVTASMCCADVEPNDVLINDGGTTNDVLCGVIKIGTTNEIDTTVPTLQYTKDLIITVTQ